MEILIEFSRRSEEEMPEEGREEFGVKYQFNDTVQIIEMGEDGIGRIYDPRQTESGEIGVLLSTGKVRYVRPEELRKA